MESALAPASQAWNQNYGTRSEAAPPTCPDQASAATPGTAYPPDTSAARRGRGRGEASCRSEARGGCYPAGPGLWTPSPSPQAGACTCDACTALGARARHRSCLSRFPRTGTGGSGRTPARCPAPHQDTLTQHGRINPTTLRLSGSVCKSCLIVSSWGACHENVFTCYTYL